MSEETRSPHPPKVAKAQEGPGPYVAVVKNHLDTEYMGSLEVELLKTNAEGNNGESSGERVQVSYLSPFYGVTPFTATSENDGYDHTQKSYGFWAVPPDIDTKVLVIFAEGNRGKGYWIGCIQDQNMNFMVPGNASTSYNTESTSKILPVAEYNKKTEEATGNNATQFVKPVNTEQLEVLKRTGLDQDSIRGTTSSSARRDLPSMVFGWSSPGPVDRRDGKPTIPSGDKLNSINIKSSRLGGTSVVMDDGDPTLFRKGPAATSPSAYASIADGGDPTIPHNELFRIRTRTGHQILLHNSEDLIYIAHGSGKSYIEMTASGKIDIYAEDSISVHSEQDLNFKAGRHINLESGDNINLKAGNRMTMSTAANWTVQCGADGMLTCAGSSNISSAAHKETAGRIDMNSGSAVAAQAQASPGITRTPGPGSGPEKENKNPAEHTAIKQNNSLARNTPATDTEDKTETSEDTFKHCQTPAASGNPNEDRANEEALAKEKTEKNPNASLVTPGGELSALDQIAEDNLAAAQEAAKGAVGGELSALDQIAESNFAAAQEAAKSAVGGELSALDQIAESNLASAQKAAQQQSINLNQAQAEAAMGRSGTATLVGDA
jgi:hypothetical protein